MSTLETNSIGKYSGNNVSIDDALNLKSYTTAQRDALTSVAGDTIYNSDDNKVQVYTGSAWEDLGGLDAFALEYLVIAGGGGGIAGYASTNGGGGGGAGGYVCNVSGEKTGGNLDTTDTDFYVSKSKSYDVSVGAGATGGGGRASRGSESYFQNIIAVGGGSACGDPNAGGGGGKDGGSGGGGVYGNPTGVYENRDPGKSVARQGFDGGYGGLDTNINFGPGGGGGGAGAVGGNGQNNSSTNCNAGDGGAGLSSSITGSAVTRAGGGGGGIRSDTGSSVPGTGGAGGGGNGGSANSNGNAGTDNTGGGGGGGSGDDASYSGGNGGSGVVILRYATADVASYSQTGLTITSSTDGSDTVLEITAGTGTITFS